MKIINELHMTIRRDYAYQDQRSGVRRFTINVFYETDKGVEEVNYAKLFDPEDFEALFHRLMVEAEYKISKHLQDTPAL